jgi:hypothetical protein
MFNFWKKKPKLQPQEGSAKHEPQQPIQQQDFSLSLESVIRSMTQQEVDELNAALDRYDPAEAEKIDIDRNRVLGFDRAVTSYEGKGETLVGLTKWKDTRDGKKYELKTHIVKETYGLKKFVDYRYTTTFNGRTISQASEKNVTKETMVTFHTLHRNINQSRLQHEYYDDENFSVEAYFYKKADEIDEENRQRQLRKEEREKHYKR